MRQSFLFRYLMEGSHEFKLLINNVIHVTSLIGKDSADLRIAIMDPGD
jgi:hypothetical protein